MKELIATLAIFGIGMAAMEWLSPLNAALVCGILVVGALLWPGFTKPKEH